MSDDLDDESLRRVQRDRVLRRQTNELVGLARGVLLDGEVTPREASGLIRWLEENPVCREVWPGSVIYDALRAFVAAGDFGAEACDGLRGLMMQLVEPRAREVGNASTTLPLTIPPPRVVHRGRTFCFTGEFAFGSRRHCHEAAAARCATPVERVTARLDYLVIGAVGSEVWRHSSFGTKILKAAELCERGSRLAIISEARWVDSLDG